MSFREERIGNQRLILGDCLEVMPTLGRVDAVVTDPPYGLNYAYNTYTDELEQTRALVAEMIGLARAQADRVVIFPGVHNVQHYPAADWLCCWSWRSTSHFGKCGYSMWQPILFYGTDLEGFGSVNGQTKTDSFHFPDGAGVGFLAPEARAKHPCPKPLKVMERLVARFSNGAVLDPFMGSGTTLVACQKLGRHGIGIEIDPDYFEIACKRVEEAARQPDLFIEPTPKTEQINLFGGGE